MTPLEKYDFAVAEYISDLKSTGISVRTIDNYNRRLRYFREYWSATEPTENPGTPDIRGWRDLLLSNGVSPKTVRQYLVELGAFFAYATDDSMTDRMFEKNPVSKRIMPQTKGEDKKPYDKLFDNEDYKKLFANIPQDGEKNWARNYAIVVLLLDGKIRNAELLDMKLSDIDFKYKEAVIPKGKGNKYRVVTLTDISITAIKLYLESGERPEDISDDDYLFGTTAEHKFGGAFSGAEKWHRGSSQWLSKLVENHVYNVTGKHGFRSHSLRHNGARLDLNAGASLERIQSELGHSSVSTTEIYAGRLSSVRHQTETEDVIKSRDEWAEKNKESLPESEENTQCSFEQLLFPESEVS